MGRSRDFSRQIHHHKLLYKSVLQLDRKTHTMASQTQGIQQLLTAEKRAAEKVSEARKRKNRRLKQAKEEAQAEIEKYKAEREAAFKNHEAKYAGSKGDVAARIDQDAKARIDAMNQSVNANKAKVISGLIDAVCNIEPKVHVNYRA